MKRYRLLDQPVEQSGVPAPRYTMLSSFGLAPFKHRGVSGMSGFGLAQVKEQGASIVVDPGNTDPHAPAVKTTWFEFSIEDSRIQEVVDHLKKIGIDCDPRKH